MPGFDGLVVGVSGQRFRGGRVFRPCRLLYHSNPGLIRVKKKFQGEGAGVAGVRGFRDNKLLLGDEDGQVTSPSSQLNESSEPLELGQFETSCLFPSGVTSFLGGFLDLVSSRSSDAFLKPARMLKKVCTAANRP